MRTDKLKILIIFILATGLFILTPYFVRTWNADPYMPNSEAYYHQRIFESRAVSYDQIEGRAIPFNILDLLPHGASWDFIVTKILLIAMALGIIILCYSILDRHNMSEKNVWAIMILLISSPIFIYTFIGFNTYAIIIFLTLLSAYLLIEGRIALSALIFALSPFIDIYGSLVSAAFMTLYIFSSSKEVRRYRTFFIIAIASIAASMALNYSLGYNVVRTLPIDKSSIITDIGATIGISFSALILAIIGMALLWQKGLKNLLIYLTIILLIVIAVFNSFMRIYLNFLFVIYAGFAFMYILRRKWSIQIIKKVTILLIVCSILFTSLVYITKLVNSDPSSNYVDALRFLGHQALPPEKVLSMPDKGYMIEYFSARSVFVDMRTEDKQALADYDNITSSRNLERTEELLDKYNIKYIVIDDAFMTYLEERQGLLFLIETSNKFKSIYKNDDVEIWLYTGKSA